MRILENVLQAGVSKYFWLEIIYVGSNPACLIHTASPIESKQECQSK